MPTAIQPQVRPRFDGTLRHLEKNSQLMMSPENFFVVIHFYMTQNAHALLSPVMLAVLTKLNALAGLHARCVRGEASTAFSEATIADRQQHRLVMGLQQRLPPSMAAVMMNQSCLEPQGLILARQKAIWL